MGKQLPNWSRIRNPWTKNLALAWTIEPSLLELIDVFFEWVRSCPLLDIRKITSNCSGCKQNLIDDAHCTPTLMKILLFTFRKRCCAFTVIFIASALWIPFNRFLHCWLTKYFMLPREVRVFKQINPQPHKL